MRESYQLETSHLFVCLFVLSVWVFLLACMLTYPFVCLVLTETRREHQIPGTGITNTCELTSGIWELNPGPFGRAASS